MFKRSIAKKVKEVSKSYSCVLVTGARQVGKTTLLRDMLSGQRGYVTLDDLQERKLAKSDPAMFLSLHPAPVLIDEVQYAPELFSYIKIAVDNGAKPGSFWLTGSQIFRLMDLAKETLAGRVAILHMTPFSQQEIFGKGVGEPFSLDLQKLVGRKKGNKRADLKEIYHRIWQGSMPGYVSGKYSDRNVFYGSFLETYVSRDVSEIMPKVDKLRFLDFIRACACRVSQMLNIHDIALDVGVSDVTARHWLDVLEKSDIVYLLRPYHNNLLKRTVKTPKLYFYDCGLVCYLTKYTSAEILGEGALSGSILENYVVTEILKSYHNDAQDCLIWYFRDNKNREIDIVMEENGKLLPMEIKRTQNPGSELVHPFTLLDKGNMPRGTGAVICLKEELSAFDKDNLIVPVWLI